MTVYAAIHDAQACPACGHLGSDHIERNRIVKERMHCRLCPLTVCSFYYACRCTPDTIRAWPEEMRREFDTGIKRILARVHTGQFPPLYAAPTSCHATGDDRFLLLKGAAWDLRAEGIHGEARIASLMVDNKLRCVPTLADRAVERIAQSVSSWRVLQ